MSGRLLALIACGAALAWAAQAASPAERERQIERGHQVYVDGTSPAGEEIVAILGEGMEVPASAVPCAGCHGRDGRGRPEGGVTPTDITWSRLARPYGAVAPGGRRHPAYDAVSMERSLVEGVDPGGTLFHAAMPRYRMGRQDMADLVAYLQTLGEAVAPGVSEGTITIGLLLPSSPQLAGAADAVRGALEGRVAQLNRQGGRYGRSLELRPLLQVGGPGVRRAGAADLLAESEVFAVLAPLLAGVDVRMVELCAERRIPVLTPFSAGEADPVTPGRYVFSLLAGLEAQARALVRQARQSEDVPPRPVVLAPDDVRLDAAVAAALDAASGWAEIAVRRYPRGSFDAEAVAGELAAAAMDPVVFLGSGEEALGLSRAAVLLGWGPRLLTAGSAGTALLDAPPELQGRVFAALPAPPHLSAAAAGRYGELAAAAGLAPEHLAAQVVALATAEVLFEGLTRAGRALDRERFVETLEGLRRFPTGYLPPVSFGPGRRVGAPGAFLAEVDLARRAYVAAPGWIEIP